MGLSGSLFLGLCDAWRGDHGIGLLGGWFVWLPLNRVSWSCYGQLIARKRFPVEGWLWVADVIVKDRRDNSQKSCNSVSLRFLV